MKGQCSSPAGSSPIYCLRCINTHIDVTLKFLLYLSGLGVCYWCGNRVCVCPFHIHTHSPCCPMVLSEVQPEVSPTSQFSLMMFVPSKPEQLLGDFGPHHALSRSRTQPLLSSSLIPLWFILVLLIFPECPSASLSVLRPLPSPTLYQWNTHLGGGVAVCECPNGILFRHEISSWSIK